MECERECECAEVSGMLKLELWLWLWLLPRLSAIGESVSSAVRSTDWE